VPAASTLGPTDASKGFTLSQSSCGVALVRVVLLHPCPDLGDHCQSRPRPGGVVQQARNLTMTLAEQKQKHRILIRDRDSKFTGAFDEVFRSEGLRLIKAPIAARRAKAHAERWIGSA
jgi:hypothetical protein